MRFFARHQPILVTIEAQSTAILKMQLASDRSAETWKAHFDDLGDHRFPQHRHGLRSGLADGGLSRGLPRRAMVCDRFHEFQDLFDRRRQLERKAYAAIAKEDEAAHTFHNAKARPIWTSGSNTMNGPTTRVSTPWHDTISLISCSISSVTPYTCVPLVAASYGRRRPRRADAPA